MIETINKVFVYGTLREGRSNHRVVKPFQAAPAKEAVVPGYTLRRLSPSIPMAFEAEGEQVVGQVIELQRPRLFRALQQLDLLEGEGSLYIRKVVKTLDGDNCYMYVAPDAMELNASRYELVGEVMP